MLHARSFERVRGLAPPADLDPRDVHVWCVPLDLSTAAPHRLSGLLSAEEHSRANSFRFERDRHRYIAARGVLRTLLGGYIKCPAEQVRFSYSTTGKPSIERHGRGSRPRFTVSRSGRIALMAFCASEDVGVDVELVQEMDNAEGIVRSFFCPEEIEEWMKLPVECQTRAFFDCWTRKEAFVKAMGEGLSMPLDAFRVSFCPGEAPTISLRPDAVQRSWSMFDVSPSSEYAGALAIPGSGWNVRCLLVCEDSHGS